MVLLYLILTCISCFICFANELFLAVYFICILDKGNDVRQNSIQMIFLFELKMGHKAVETTSDFNNAFGPETFNEHTLHCRFKKFCKVD